MTLHGFIPVLTHRFPLDALLTPYVERYAPAALMSAAELRAATLTLLSGVGQVIARALSAAGIPELPTLARTPPAQLTAAGFTLRTAERLTQSAQAYSLLTLSEPTPAPARSSPTRPGSPAPAS